MLRINMITMKTDTQNPHTFIVRLWHEKADGGDFILRGSVDDVRSGERSYFQDIERLKEVIAQMMEKVSAEKRNGNEQE